jgi:Domain of unknown function (DUF397)
MGCTGPLPTGPRWRTSSYSGANGSCVEVAELPDGARAVRDTKDRTRTPLTFTPAAWSAFLGAVREGDFGRSPR